MKACQAESLIKLRNIAIGLLGLGVLVFLITRLSYPQIGVGVIGGLAAIIPALLLQGIILGLFGIYRADSGSIEHFDIHWWKMEGFHSRDDPNVDWIVAPYYIIWIVFGFIAAVVMLTCRL